MEVNVGRMSRRRDFGCSGTDPSSLNHISHYLKNNKKLSFTFHRKLP